MEIDNYLQLDYVMNCATTNKPEDYDKILDNKDVNSAYLRLTGAVLQLEPADKAHCLLQMLFQNLHLDLSLQHRR